MSETPDWLNAWQKSQDALLENQTKMAEAFQQVMLKGKAPHIDGGGSGSGGSGGDSDEGGADSDSGGQADWSAQQAAMMEQWRQFWQTAANAAGGQGMPEATSWVQNPWTQNPWTQNPWTQNPMPSAGANPAAFGFGAAPQSNPFQAWQNPNAPAGMAAMAAMNPFMTGHAPMGGFPGAGAGMPGMGFPAFTGAPQASAWTDFLGNLAAGNPFVGTAMAGTPQDWMAMVPDWANQPGMAEAFAAMKAMSFPAWWSADMPQNFKEWLDKVATGPQLADMPNPQAQNARAWKELLDYQQAVAHLSGIMSRAWEQAYHRFSESYLDQDAQEVDPNQALQDWIKIANTALLEAQRSPEFLDAQRDLMRAGLTIKQRQHKQADDWCKQVNIPARSEVDDLIEVVHSLRQQLADLRNEMNSLKGRKRS